MSDYLLPIIVMSGLFLAGWKASALWYARELKMLRLRNALANAMLRGASPQKRAEKAHTWWSRN